MKLNNKQKIIYAGAGMTAGIFIMSILFLIVSPSVPTPKPKITVEKLNNSNDNELLKMTIGDKVFYRERNKEGWHWWKNSDFESIAWDRDELERQYQKYSIAQLNSNTGN